MTASPAEANTNAGASHAAAAAARSGWRWLELFCLFLLLPTIAFVWRDAVRPMVIPGLLLLALFCYALISRDSSFKRFRLLNAAAVPALLRRRLPVFVLGGLACVLLYSLLDQPRWFAIFQDGSSRWLALLLVYPLLSAWPQELIYRTFLFHRYKKIIPRKKHRAVLSAIVFAYAHLMYANPVAVGMALVGGALFAYTYAKTRSTLACVIEHSLWGLWLFSLGLGHYLDSAQLD